MSKYDRYSDDGAVPIALINYVKQLGIKLSVARFTREDGNTMAFTVYADHDGLPGLEQALEKQKQGFLKQAVKAVASELRRALEKEGFRCYEHTEGTSFDVSLDEKAAGSPSAESVAEIAERFAANRRKQFLDDPKEILKPLRLQPNDPLAALIAGNVR